MADTLLVHYDPAHPLRATWSHVNHLGELTSRITSGAIADAAVVAEQHRVVLANETLLAEAATLRSPGGASASQA